MSVVRFLECTSMWFHTANVHFTNLHRYLTHAVLVKGTSFLPSLPHARNMHMHKCVSMHAATTRNAPTHCQRPIKRAGASHTRLLLSRTESTYDPQEPVPHTDTQLLHCPQSLTNLHTSILGGEALTPFGKTHTEHSVGSEYLKSSSTVRWPVYRGKGFNVHVNYCSFVHHIRAACCTRQQRPLTTNSSGSREWC